MIVMCNACHFHSSLDLSQGVQANYSTYPQQFFMPLPAMAAQHQRVAAQQQLSMSK